MTAETESASCPAGFPEASKAAVRTHRVDSRWLNILRRGLGHEIFALDERDAAGKVAALPLALVRSRLFGRFLVSLPYINTGGVDAADAATRRCLVDRAVALADHLNVRYLELRHEIAEEHAALTVSRQSKVHMRLPLPGSSDILWSQFSAKVRNQVRKGESHQPEVRWGGAELLPAFYDVFSRNMRDLGTPVYGRKLFAAILAEFGADAELCVVRHDAIPTAAALLIHSNGTSTVPSASSLRSHNSTNANMLMYWHLLRRAVERGSRTFDFGRSTIDSNTFRFKKQWGAAVFPSVWQYYVRHGAVDAMRPENSRFRLAVRVWRRLPLRLTQWLGPKIVRGIP